MPAKAAAAAAAAAAREGSDGGDADEDSGYFGPGVGPHDSGGASTDFYRRMQ